MRLRVRKPNLDEGPWLFELYCCTMKKYVEPVWGWDEALQRSGFFDHLGVENFKVLSLGDDDVGAYCLEPQRDHIWLHLVLIDTKRQSRGIGRQAMECIQKEAASANTPLRFCTLKNNPATEFYRHLGYHQYKEDAACFYFEKT